MEVYEKKKRFFQLNDEIDEDNEDSVDERFEY